MATLVAANVSLISYIHSFNAWILFVNINRDYARFLIYYCLLFSQTRVTLAGIIVLLRELSFDVR